MPSGLPNGTYSLTVIADGISSHSIAFVETTSGATANYLGFPSGFASVASLLKLNGSAKINGSLLQLTEGGTGEAGSTFTTTPVAIGSFTNQFAFQLLNPNGDGFTFCIQGAGPTALGAGGGGLGYGATTNSSNPGIPKSIAITFGLSNTPGDDSTGLYVNGARPTNAGSINLSNTGINLHSGHIFNVAMAYDGTTLKVAITDTVTGATVAQSYSVNIPSIVGSTSAYLGFTGSTGALTATQNILSWTYLSSLVTPPPPTFVTATASLGQVRLNWTASSGASSYNIYRSLSSNGEGSTPYQTGVTGTSFTDAAVSGGTTYYYQVTAVGIAGEGGPSAEVSATTPQPTLNFSRGFAGASGDLSLNGSAKINGSFLQLTDGGASEGASAYVRSPQNIAKFATQFSFQLVNATGDGFTFTIQNAGLTALGASGGGLGYGVAANGSNPGIPESVAIKFDLHNNSGEGNDSTGLYIDGARPTNVGSINLSNTGINLHSGHVFNVTMTYDGTTLNVTITDTVTGASASQSYVVNIPNVVGASTAYVGFTGATGDTTADQRILSWSFASKPAAPTGLTAMPTTGQISLTWTPVTGAATYNVYRSTTPGGEGATPFQTGLTSPAFTDTDVTSGVTYYYEVTAVDPFGESPDSSEVFASL